MKRKKKKVSDVFLYPLKPWQEQVLKTIKLVGAAPTVMYLPMRTAGSNIQAGIEALKRFDKESETKQ